MHKIFNIIRKFLGYIGLNEIVYQLSLSNKIQIQLFLQEKLRDRKYEDPLRVSRYEFQSHSQNGEDGILHEIFRRIGTANQYFIEFGISVI